jgi:hypothetical protein
VVSSLVLGWGPIGNPHTILLGIIVLINFYRLLFYKFLNGFEGAECNISDIYMIHNLTAVTRFLLVYDLSNAWFVSPSPAVCFFSDDRAVQPGVIFDWQNSLGAFQFNV